MVYIALALLFISVNAVATDIELKKCYSENIDSKQQLSPIILDAAKKLCDKWEDKFEKISWQVLSIEKKNNLDTHIDAISYEVGDLRNGRIWVRTNTSLNGKQQIGMIWFRIKGYSTVWSVKRDVSINSILRAEDLTQKLGDVITTNITSEQVITQPVGLFVRKVLRKGEIISALSVSEPPLIMQNQNIQILVKNNGLEITARAIALSSGWHVGDVIAVLVNGATEKTEAIVAKRGWANVSI